LQTTVPETAAAKAPSRVLLLPGTAAQAEHACREAALDMGLRAAEAASGAEDGAIVFRDPQGWGFFRMQILVDLEPSTGGTEMKATASSVGSAIPVQLDRSVALFVSLAEQHLTQSGSADAARLRQWARSVFRILPALRWLLLAWFVGAAVLVFFLRFDGVSFFVLGLLPILIFLSLPWSVRRRLAGGSGARFWLDIVGGLALVAVIVAVDLLVF